jgi:deazaflavin-dependent oxidoreductase (nitroreductase family)
VRDGPTVDPALAGEDYCYLTTTGRKTGQPHEIEIWFGLAGPTLYVLSGGRDRSDWVKNIQREPGVTVRIGRQTFAGRARAVGPGDEDAAARKLLVGKYAPGSSGDLSNWGRTALPVAVDLTPLR